MEFAEKLTLLRRREGMSQEQLADRLGITRQSVSKWESGASVPELAKLIAIADLFGVSLDYLVRDREDCAKGQENSVWQEAREGGRSERTGTYGGNPDLLEEKIDRLERELRGYEYISKKKIGRIPLVCVRFTPNRGPVRAAKGIIAIGNAAVGVVAIGGFSFGVISIGMIGMGLLALGGVVAGLLAFGGVAFGLIAVGAVAIGGLAIGTSSVGIYSCGMAAVGREIAVGNHVDAQTVVGLECKGEHILQYKAGISQETVRAFLLEHHPSLHGWLADLLSWLGANVR